MVLLIEFSPIIFTFVIINIRVYFSSFAQSSAPWLSSFTLSSDHRNSLFSYTIYQLSPYHYKYIVFIVFQPIEGELLKHRVATNKSQVL